MRSNHEPTMSSVPPQPKLYKTVIEDVIQEVRELFLDEGVDEQVLQELKTVTSTTYSCCFVYLCGK